MVQMPKMWTVALHGEITSGPTAFLSGWPIFNTMNERNVFPKIPRWCYAMCHNAGNDLCIEDCAEFRDARHFEPKDLNIEDMPRFPRDGFENEMTGEERKVCVGFYM